MDILHYINNLLKPKNKPIYKFMPLRGKMKNIPEKLTPNELFYVTDAKILGVANSEGKPVFLVNIEYYDLKKEFPEIPEQNKLYYSRIEDMVYFYDYNNNKYDTIRIKDRFLTI